MTNENKKDMGINTYKLTSHVKITLSWKSSANKTAMLDLSAFMLDDDGQFQGLDSVVFYGSQINEKGQYHCPDDSIILDSHKQNNGVIRQLMQVDLEKMAPIIKTIVLVISFDTKNLNSKFSCAEVSIEDENEILCQLPIDYVNDDSVGGIIIGNIYRYGDSWRYENEESTFAGGLEIPYYRWVSKEIKEKEVSFNKEELLQHHESDRKSESEEKKGVHNNNKSGEDQKVNVTYPLPPKKRKNSFGTMPKSKKSAKGKSASKQTKNKNNQKLSAIKLTETEATSVQTTATDDIPKTNPKRRGGARGVMPYKNNHK